MGRLREQMKGDLELRGLSGKTRGISLLRKIRQPLLILKDILLTLRYSTP